MNSNYYGYGNNQNRLYFNNQDSSYGRPNDNNSGNKYSGISNSNFFNFFISLI